MKDSNFEKIEMFRCKYCRKLFFSDSRHKCKFNPDFQNCFSCRNCAGIEEYQTNNQEKDYMDIVTKNLDLSPRKKVVCRCGKDQSLLSLSQLKWNLKCKSWIIIEKYEGKASFAKNCRINQWKELGSKYGDDPIHYSFDIFN